MHGAMHNDIVTVRLFQRSTRRGRAGEVTRVVQRANDHIVGRFEKQGRLGIVTPTDRRIHGDILVGTRRSAERRPGDIVVRPHHALRRCRARHGRARSRRCSARRPTRVSTSRSSSASTDCARAFPPEVEEAAARRSPTTCRPSAETGREDLRELLTVTIDPVDARDFDDAISLERHDAGWRLRVHIADVCDYVAWADAIDDEAVGARDLRLPRRPRPADAARASFQRHLLAQPRRRPLHDDGGARPGQDRRSLKRTVSTRVSSAATTVSTTSRSTGWLDARQRGSGRRDASGC